MLFLILKWKIGRLLISRSVYLVPSVFKALESVLIMHSWIFSTPQMILSNTNMTCIIVSSEKSFEAWTQYHMPLTLPVRRWKPGHQVLAPEAGCTRTWLQVAWSRPQCASLLLPSIQKIIGYLSGIEEFSRNDDLSLNETNLSYSFCCFLFF